MAVNLEERVSTLEAIFGRFMAQTEAAIIRMERSTEAFKIEMRDFKNEMSEFKNETRAEARRMNRQWGELANKMGTMVEDLVYPSIGRIIREEFDLEAKDIMVRYQRSLKDGQSKEFDVIVLAGELVFLNSTKTTLRNQNIEQFIGEIKIFREFFPEYQKRKLVGILAALNINDAQLKHAEKKGFMVLGVGDQIMEVKNRDGFKPKLW